MRTAYEVLTNEPLEKLEFEELGDPGRDQDGRDPGCRTRTEGGGGPRLGQREKGLRLDSFRRRVRRVPFHRVHGLSGRLYWRGRPADSDQHQGPRRERTVGLNEDDRQQPLRKSHENAEVELLYQDFFKEPLGHLAHRLLHTEYTDRSDAV